MEAVTDKMESVDLDAPPVLAASLNPVESQGIPVKNGGSAASVSGNGFVPLVTVVGFHHAR